MDQKSYFVCAVSIAVLVLSEFSFFLELDLSIIDEWILFGLYPLSVGGSRTLNIFCSVFYSAMACVFIELN